MSSLFDAEFFKKEGASILAQFLLPDGRPDPSELVMRWANSLNIYQPDRRTTRIRELEPVATDFLDRLNRALKAEPELKEINNRRSLEQIAGGIDTISSNIEAFRRRLENDKSTPGTRRDYLRWLIERNLYLDPRGTFQTQRYVQVKLDEVYISLRAQHEETLGSTDRHLLEKGTVSLGVTSAVPSLKEILELETELAVSDLTAEEVEDQRERLLTRSRRRLTSPSNVHSEVLGLAEAVNRHERVVVLGDPGSGKTTLLRYLALKHAEALQNGETEAGADLGTAHFPILIRIASYAEHGMPHGKSLSDFLADYCSMHECSKAGLADLLATELDSGNCLILLDGLDEIVSADERRGVIQQIEDFVRCHDNRPNRFVITSRVAGYRSAPLSEPFAHYNVQEMDETQMRRFLECWCSAVEAAQTPELSIETRETTAKREIEAIMEAVQTSPGVRHMAANPLLLRILALIHRTGAQLPQKRIELYRLAADTLARTWRTAQGVPESALIKDEYLTPLLSKLAYWLHLNKDTGIATERQVYEVLGEEWANLHGLDWNPDKSNVKIREEVDKFLLAVREHTGLFVERAPKRYGFMHLTFEEYYAARYLVARSKTRARLIRGHLHDPRWNEPILLALGFVSLESRVEAQELLEMAILAEGEDAKALGLVPSEYEELLGRDHLFALRCLGDNIPIPPRLMQRLLLRMAHELVYENERARFRRYRQALGETLGYLKRSEYVSHLLPFLVTAMYRSNKVFQADYIKRAAYSLGQLGQASPEAVTILLTALRDHNYIIFSPAAQSLEQLRQVSPEVIAALLAALHDHDSTIRAWAARIFGQVGHASSEVIAALLAALHDHDFAVRTRAAQSLGQLEQTSPEIISALLAALHDDYSTVRYRVVQSLGQVGRTSPQALSALLTALHDDNSAVRTRAAQSLGQLEQTSPEIISALLAALHDYDYWVRSSAAQSLKRVSRTSSQALTAPHDDNSRLHSRAAPSLKQVEQVSPEIVSALSEALQSAKDWSLRRDSARLLGKSSRSDEPTIQLLCRGLEDEDDDVCIACVEGLAQLGRRFPDATETIKGKLIQIINDSNFEFLVSEFSVLDKRSRAGTGKRAQDYAYDALWLLIVGDGVEER